MLQKAIHRKRTFLEWVAFYFIQTGGLFGEHEMYADDTAKNVYDDIYTLMGYGQQYHNILFMPTEERIAFASVRRKEIALLLQIMAQKQAENDLLTRL